MAGIGHRKLSIFYAPNALFARIIRGNLNFFPVSLCRPRDHMNKALIQILFVQYWIMNRQSGPHCKTQQICGCYSKRVEKN